MNTGFLLPTIPYLDFREVIACSAVSRNWRARVDTEATWSALVLLYIPTCAPPKQGSHVLSKSIFSDYIGSAIKHSPNAQLMSPMKIGNAVGDSLHNVTSHFYATAPFLTATSKVTLAQRHVDVMRAHIHQCSVKVTEGVSALQRVAQSNGTLEQHHSVFTTSVDEALRTLDTVDADVSAFQTLHSIRQIFHIFELRVIEDILRLSRAGEGGSLNSVRSFVPFRSFLDMEIELQDQTTAITPRSATPTGRRPTPQSSTPNSSSTSIHSATKRSWELWKETFPLPAYYELRERLYWPGRAVCAVPNGMDPESSLKDRKDLLELWGRVQR
eukprot:PhF_6_TR6192/c2_g1_i1/m.9295